METLSATLPHDVEIELALSAAPPHLRADAAVYVFTDQGYAKVRDGWNGFTCLVNRDAIAYGETADFGPTCWDRHGASSYLPVMLRVGALIADGQDAEAIKRDIAKGFEDGRFLRPEKAGVAYMLAGTFELDTTSGAIKQQTFPGHYMVLRTRNHQ